MRSREAKYLTATVTPDSIFCMGKIAELYATCILSQLIKQDLSHHSAMKMPIKTRRVVIIALSIHGFSL